MPFKKLSLMNEFAPLNTLDAGACGVQVQVLRLDQFFPELSGNKIFKLKYNILSALEQGCEQLLSFGGAYSNHIHALAMAGKIFGIKTIGIIRGQRQESLNPTLCDASAAGMKLVFVSREEYRRRNNDEYIRQLKQQYSKCMVIPEGGNNALGVRGCSEILQHIHHHIGSDYDYIALPCGTGATLAGLLCAIPADKTLLGFSVLKAPGLIEAEVLRSLAESSKIASGLWEIQEAYHCGGYARLNQQLVDFVRSFEHKFNINLDYIYTGKCFLGLFDMINKKNFRPGSRVVVIHTGGLQGNRGLYDKVQKFPVQHENLLSC